MYSFWLPTFRVSPEGLKHRRRQVRVELEIDLRRRDRPAPLSGKAEKAEKRRLDREERRLRQIALAYHIDHLVVTDQVESLAEIARMCGLSRARVSQVTKLLGSTLFSQTTSAA
jgi:hypothetical protein